MFLASWKQDEQQFEMIVIRLAVGLLAAGRVVVRSSAIAPAAVLCQITIGTFVVDGTPLMTSSTLLGSMHFDAAMQAVR